MPSCLVGKLSGPASDGWMGWSKEGRAGLRQVREKRAWGKEKAGDQGGLLKAKKEPKNERTPQS